MARPVWRGSLTFGLVTLPIKMYTATDSHTIHFHQIQRGTADRIRNQRVNERTGEEVAAEDIVKGYDVGEEYVLVEPEELDDIAPVRSRALEISGFVELADVEPIFFDRTYYLGPQGKEYAKVYALLRKALDRSGKAGIATFVMRNRAYLVAVKAEDDILTLHTLHWADEVRDPHEEVADLPGKPKITDRELMDALHASLERTKGRPKSHGKSKSVSKNNGRGHGTGRAKRAELDRCSKAELYQLATEADVRGRSSMSRADLIKALSA
ncbi:non-homologous end joining protein Ku [Streptomyces sp. NPDC002446]